MNKKLLLAALFGLGLTLSFTACSDDDDKKGPDDVAAADIDCTTENVQKWATYMGVVAQKLVDDSETLLKDWETSYEGGQSYAAQFIAHNGNQGYQSASDCVEEILDGCADIANEVGSAKIGDPYDLFLGGDKTAALYAVESWYSWHSIDDYSNNIRSIQNAYNGSRNGQVAQNSISNAVQQFDAQLDAQAKAYIQAAYDAIQAIPAPLRNNIVCPETEAAMDACADLEDFISKQLKPRLLEAYADNDEALDAVVENYVNAVVLPTYRDLVAKNRALLTAVSNFTKAPSNAGFEACADAWLAAREPWETSEAFLFGPVANKGLDPNMDSWPLDQDGIVAIMNNGDYSALDWSGEYEEEEDGVENERASAIAEAQSLRGYHTLEFLIFKDGKARTIK